MLSANELVSRLAPVDSSHQTRANGSPSRVTHLERQPELEDDDQTTSLSSSRHIVLIDLR